MRTNKVVYDIQWTFPFRTISRLFSRLLNSKAAMVFKGFCILVLLLVQGESAVIGPNFSPFAIKLNWGPEDEAYPLELETPVDDHELQIS